MKKLVVNISLLVMMVTLPVSASASIYSPRTPANHHWKAIHQVASKALGSQWHSKCPRLSHSGVTAIVQQGPQVNLNCEIGYRGYAAASIWPTNGAGTVNGYFLFHVQDDITGFSFNVKTGQFSKPASQCLITCYFSGEYRPGGNSLTVEWVQFWADHDGEIIAAQCEQ